MSSDGAEAEPLLRLQRQVGNASVVAMLKAGVSAGPAEPSEDRPSDTDGPGLPPGLRARIERVSGLSMADVTVHRNSSEPRRIGAEAFTRGADVHLGPGYERHLAHEAWHVVQQKAGRVAPNLILDGMAVNLDPRFERDADRHAEALTRGGSSGLSGSAGSSESVSMRGPEGLLAAATVTRPVVQGVFTRAQLRQIVRMSRDVRIEYLSHVSPADLEEIATSTNLFENFGGSEEWDELRGVRAARAPDEPYRRQWLGTLPVGNARDAAQQMAHVGGRQPTTAEESEAMSRDTDAFLTLVQGKVRIVYVEDCALEDEPDLDDEPDHDHDEEEAAPSEPSRRLLPDDEDMAFDPPPAGKSLFLLGRIVASRADEVAIWKEHLRRGVVQSGETGDMAGRYGPEPDDGVDELTDLLAKLSIDPGRSSSREESGDVSERGASERSGATTASTEEHATPMDVDDDAMEVDVSADLLRVVVRGIHLPSSVEVPPDGVVAMDIDDANAMDIEVHNAFDSDVEMTDAQGEIWMQIDEAGGITAVNGSIAMHMELVGEEHQVDIVMMDIDVEGAAVAEDDHMELASSDESVAMAIDVARDDGGGLHASFLQWRDPAKARKSAKPGPRTILPGLRHDEDTGSSSRGESVRGESGTDEEVDALTDQLAALRVSFTSDVDGGREVHEVGPNAELADILVASNPIPVKTILASKMWLGVALQAGVLATLGVRATAAATCLKNYATGRSKANGLLLRAALRDIAKVLKAVNAVAKYPKPDVSKSVGYPSNSDPTEGSHVIIDKLSLRMSAIAGHGPTTDSRLTTAIRNRAPKNEGSLYKRMHLLNDNVFGPGVLWNLTPGPTQSNSDMEHGVETLLKRAIIDKALVMDFEAIVKYRKDPTVASQTELNQNPDAYRFDKITFKAKQYDWDAIASDWKVSKSPDPDVKGISNSTVFWKWGSLTPLEAKPKILSTTDVGELTGIGFSKGLALRMVAFNTYNVANGFPYPVSGKNKKDALLGQLKAYEVAVLKKASPKVMGWDNWKANAVLWS